MPKRFNLQGTLILGWIKDLFVGSKESHEIEQDCSLNDSPALVHPIIVFGDVLSIFDTVFIAENTFEEWYFKKYIREVYDGSGKLLKYVPAKLPPNNSKNFDWKLKIESCAPLHQRRLRAQLISYLLDDPNLTYVDEALFNLNLQELIEKSKITLRTRK